MGACRERPSALVVLRAATIVGPVSPHTMKAKGLFSKFLYWNFIKVGRCLSNGKIATDPAPFVKKMSE